MIRCLENAFRHFGGLTATLVLDSRSVMESSVLLRLAREDQVSADFFARLPFLAGVSGDTSLS